MITDPKILGKLAGIEERYARERFVVVGEVPVRVSQTKEHLRAVPDLPDSEWCPCPPGTSWGGDGMTAWFRGGVTVPPEHAGSRVFVRARLGGDALFFVDGEARGTFDDLHAVVSMTPHAEANHTYVLAFEAYAGHSFPGTQPFSRGPSIGDNGCRFDGVELVVERRDVTDFVFDLMALRQLAVALDDNSLRKGRIIAGLARVYAGIDAAPAECPEEVWRPKLRVARQTMGLLYSRNSMTMPQMALVGGSHIDTAWLWPVAETWRKCARTFSSTLNLMEQYPEMTFLQPAPCHAEMMRRLYPGIFERMREMVREGRWEPNGGMWVEPDCNLPSGESFVRQVLTAQRWTWKHFGYLADTLWLPDVFGYSAALPQILRGGGIEFFCTTKMSWNDTTRFPYDTFVWRGMDGTSVITHLNAHHLTPDPASLIGLWNWVQHKDVDSGRLCCYGYGDGGGGVTAEMLEIGRRVGDLEGCPRTFHTTLSNCMRWIAQGEHLLPEWSGELYLELHRGTLTSIAGIKRGNRKAEIALREAEFACTLASLRGAPYPRDELETLWKELLVNQFHDILPGSSIAQVNDEAIESFAHIVRQAGQLTLDALASFAESRPKGSPAVLLANSLSWLRERSIVIGEPQRGLRPVGKGVVWQRFEGLDGVSRLAIGGLSVPALGTTVVELAERDEPTAKSPFRVFPRTITTPHAKMRFDHEGHIVSLEGKASGRDIASHPGFLNDFFLGEDIPAAWDNWDIDADQELKMARDGRLLSREVVGKGPLQLRLRSRYALGEKSEILQDMVFHAESPRIDFETVVDWHEKRKLLKVFFTLDVLADNARHEIQFGHVERPTHRNLPQDRARFEVCAHKWTDLSDNGFGVALLNDCKYGVSVKGNRLGLSLIKSGVHPDPRGDEGVHTFTYSLLPHSGPFHTESVIRPAYELNIPITYVGCDAGVEAVGSLVSVDAPNVIVESVKWAEDGDGFVLRLYEAGRMGRHVKVAFGVPVREVFRANLLEEVIGVLPLKHGCVSFYMRPFEVMTLRCKV